MFYHKLKYWKRIPYGVKEDTKIIGSDADTIEEAARERSRIAKKYHPDTIIELTTHKAE